MVNCDQQEKVLRYCWECCYKYKINFEGMLNFTVYEWVGVNSHSLSRPAGPGPGLYKQIVVQQQHRQNKCVEISRKHMTFKSNPNYTRHFIVRFDSQIPDIGKRTIFGLA